MKKVIIDFVAYRSVTVALNDDDDEEVAIEKAEEYLSEQREPVEWICQDVDLPNKDDDYGPVIINPDEVMTCKKCGTEFVDINHEYKCPNCGEDTI